MVGYFSKSKTKYSRENVAGIIFDGENVLLVAKHGLRFWHFVHKEIENGDSPEEALKKEILEKTGIAEFEFVRKLKCYNHGKFNSDLEDISGFRGEDRSFFIMKVDQEVEINLKKEFKDYKWVPLADLKNYTPYYPKLLSEIFKEIERIQDSPHVLNLEDIFG